MLLEAFAEDEDEDDRKGEGEAIASASDAAGADDHSDSAPSRVGSDGGRRSLLQRARARPSTKARPKKGTARQATFTPPSEQLTEKATAVLKRWKAMKQEDMCG